MAPGTSAPARYDGFDRMPIAGSWRAGRAGKTATDTDPYTGETLTEIPLANAEDLDEAYGTAREAQRDWAARLPSERAIDEFTTDHWVSVQHTKRKFAF
ncbi:hypothetical protein DQ239_05315 [Blastococcus sp. TF02-09]|uniref:aldehyde dehydrogenase family protein n=1 Tax=Blastococcus sp. TF02-09 TaxID=2250576 RepID=UPI000DE8ECC1|nr:aldehyde dehydrogenase family protein [Blastococcus sp. TF02-9]RBY79088.1 hypothetical protein DQ239_05315 [Blastococcus sp. TF02-9]